MDPLSIISGVAGVATAGSVLSRALFNLISTIHGAPREMADIARGICDLSLVLRELRWVLRDGRAIHRDRLLRAIKSVVRRIRQIHRDINGLIAGDDGPKPMARILWVFRKSKASVLLTRIESHKSTVQLMVTTMLLAIEQRRQLTSVASGQNRGSDNDDGGTASIRLDAENLVRIAGQSLQGLLLTSESGTHDQGTQTAAELEEKQATASGHGSLQQKSSSDAVSVTSVDDDELSDVLDPQIDKTAGRIQKWDAAPDDTAVWMYRLVFSGNEAVRSRAMNESQETRRLSGVGELLEAQDPVSSPKGVLISTSTDARQVVDQLLRRWTTLTHEEIGTLDIEEDESSHEADCLTKIPEPSAFLQPRPISECLEQDESPYNKSPHLDGTFIGVLEEAGIFPSAPERRLYQSVLFTMMMKRDKPTSKTISNGAELGEGLRYQLGVDWHKPLFPLERFARRTID